MKSSLELKTLRCWARGVFISALALLASASVRAAGEGFSDVVWASTARFARVHGIPSQAISSSPPDSRSPEGDQVVLIATLRKGPVRSQWLVVIESGPLTAEEAGARPPITDSVRFTTTGQELRYQARSRTALKSSWIGPFAEADRAQSYSAEESRVLVSPEFLGFGLDKTCRIWLQIQSNILKLEATGADPIRLQLSTSLRPFSPGIVEANRNAAERVGFSAAEEFDFYGLELALESFLQAAQTSPSASRLIDQVMVRPSWWSRASHFGTVATISATPDGIAPLDPTIWDITSPVFRLPVQVSLNGRVALIGNLAVTSPQHALRGCAGILEMTFAAPEDLSTLLAFRVIAARRGRLYSAAPSH